MNMKIVLVDQATDLTITLTPPGGVVTEDRTYTLPDEDGTLVTYEQLSDINNLPAGFKEACKGDDGNGVTSAQFFSTTAANSQAGQPGATDTYRITFTDNSFLNFLVYNGDSVAGIPTAQETSQAISNAVTSLIDSAPAGWATLGDISQTVTNLLTTVNQTLTTHTSNIAALKNVPQVFKSAAYTLALTDAGSSIDTTFNITIPANSSVAFPVGTVIGFSNMGINDISIIPNSGVTLILAGTTTTGTRTLKNYAMGSIRKVAVDTWMIVGAGIV